MKKTPLIPKNEPSPKPKDGDNVHQYECHVTIPALIIRTWPERRDENRAGTSYEGDQLKFFELVYGEVYQGNNLWGHSVQNQFYWMGGTDCPDG